LVLLFGGGVAKVRQQPVSQSGSPFLLAGDQLSFLQQQCLVTPEKADAVLLTVQLNWLFCSEPVSGREEDIGLCLCRRIVMPSATASQCLETTPQRKAVVPQHRSGCEAQIVLRGGQSSSMEAVRDPARRVVVEMNGWMGNDSCQCLPVMQCSAEGSLRTWRYCAVVELPFGQPARAAEGLVGCCCSIGAALEGAARTRKPAAIPHHHTFADACTCTCLQVGVLSRQVDIGGPP
jgi:hypothetical protein